MVVCSACLALGTIVVTWPVGAAGAPAGESTFLAALAAESVGDGQADPADEPARLPPALDSDSATRLLAASCGDCHGGPEPEGKFSLDSLADADSLARRHDDWTRLRQRLADGSMPPDDAEPLLLDDRLRLIEWLDAATGEALRREGESAGPPMFRRMAEYEYSNTIRDLLGTHFDAGHDLPQDLAGGEGFNNAAETLTISPIHAEKFLEAATAALDYAAQDVDSRNLLIPHRATESSPSLDAARADILEFANRAYRRPANATDVEPYVRLFQDAEADGLNFEQALFYALRGVLTSPQFLFLSEEAPVNPDVAEPLTDWELATRLSYFLWASMPDRQLREAADAGRLSDPEELRRQSLRMLEEGTHLNDSLVQFVGQWLGTADLGRSKDVDRQRHTWVQDHHVAAMRNQPVYIVESIFRTNASLLELIDADWTFMNEELASAYKLERKKIDGKFSQHLVRVTLPEEYRARSGLLGCGGVMAVTAYPRRTSPVLRGVWVLDKMLGVKLPPPPPNVPALDDSGDVVQAKTVRERLELHRADPACASCHNRIDPIGFTLENFDELGRWRDHDDGGKIDPTAELPTGQRVEGVAGLKQYLLANKEQFVRHLTQKMLGYALARGLRPSDQATVEMIVERLQAKGYKSQELMLGIVESKPFRFKGGRP
jgi:hypothetical protein